MKAGPELKIVADPAAIADEAALVILESALDAVAARGRFRIALAGGGTPRATYERLTRAPYRERMPWDHIRVFFGDERAVGPEHAD